MKLWIKRVNLASIDNLGSYIFRSAQNQAINAFKHAMNESIIYSKLQSSKTYDDNIEANLEYKILINYCQKKNPVPLQLNGTFRAEDRARTGHLDLGKVALYQMSYFRINDKNFTYFSEGKNKCCDVTIKIFICKLGYTAYLLVLLPLVALYTDGCTNCSNRPKRRPALKIPGKTR